MPERLAVAGDLTSQWPPVERLSGMKTLTPRMEQALKERGFIRDGHVRRLDRPVLPALIYQDKNPWGPWFGPGVSLGGPGERLTKDEGGVVTIGQRISAGGKEMHYDFSKPEEAQKLCERDFLAVTVPLLDLTDPAELCRALLRGSFQPVHYWPRVEGGVYAALQVAEAYGLDGLMPEIGQRLQEVTRDPEVYDSVVGTVESYPEWLPRLVEMVATLPSPPAAPQRSSPTQTPRWFGLFGRRRRGPDH